MSTLTQSRTIRSDADRAIGGVASALGRRLGMPNLLARVLFVVAAFLGFGLPLYLLLWFGLPRLTVDGEVISASDRLFGLFFLLLIPILMAIGVSGFGLTELDAFLLSAGAAVGGVMLRRGRAVVPTYISLDSEPQPAIASECSSFPEPARADRTHQPTLAPTENAEVPSPRLAGVCAWLAGSTGLNVTVLRVAVVIATVIPATFPIVPFLYGFAIFFVPRSERAGLHGH